MALLEKNANWIAYGERFFLWIWGMFRNPDQGKKKNKLNYDRVLRLCCKAQLYYLVGLTLFMVVVSKNFTEHLKTVHRQRFIETILEVSVWLILGYVLGRKRLPANFFGFVALRASLIMDKDLIPKMNNFEMKVLRSSASHGHWSVLTYNPNKNVQPLNAIGGTAIVLISAFAIWVITKYTRIDLSKHDTTALILTSVLTTIAATLSMTSYMISEFPVVKDFHLTCSEHWLITAFFGLVLILMFLCQRIFRLVRGQLKPKAFMRMQYESILFVFTLYIMVRCLPVIHNKLTLRDLLLTKSERLTKLMFPSTVLDCIVVVKAYGRKIGERLAKTSGEMMD